MEDSKPNKLGLIFYGVNIKPAPKKVSLKKKTQDPLAAEKSAAARRVSFERGAKGCSTAELLNLARARHRLVSGWGWRGSSSTIKGTNFFL